LCGAGWSSCAAIDYRRVCRLPIGTQRDKLPHHGSSRVKMEHG